MLSFEIILDGKPERFRFAMKSHAEKERWGSEHAFDLEVIGKDCVLQRYEGSRQGKLCDDTVFTLATCIEEYADRDASKAPVSARFVPWQHWYKPIIEGLQKGFGAKILVNDPPIFPPPFLGGTIDNGDGTITVIQV